MRVPLNKIKKLENKKVEIKFWNWKKWKNKTGKKIKKICQKMINIPINKFLHAKFKLFFLRFLWDITSIIKNTALFNVIVLP